MHTKKTKIKYNPPKAAAIRLTLCFPCAQNHAPVNKIPSRQPIEMHPSQRDFSSPISHIY